MHCLNITVTSLGFYEYLTEPKFKDSKEIPCKMYTMVDVCLVQKFVDQQTKLEEVMYLSLSL